MFPWTFWIIVVIVAVFVAVLVAKAIYAPIKRRRENKRWAEWRKGNEVLKPGYW